MVRCLLKKSYFRFFFLQFARSTVSTLKPDRNRDDRMTFTQNIFRYTNLSFSLSNKYKKLPFLALVRIADFDDE